MYGVRILFIKRLPHKKFKNDIFEFILYQFEAHIWKKYWLKIYLDPNELFYTVCSKKYWPIQYSDSKYKTGQDFLNRQYTVCPVSS